MSKGTVKITPTVTGHTKGKVKAVVVDPNGFGVQAGSDLEFDYNMELPVSVNDYVEFTIIDSSRCRPDKKIMSKGVVREIGSDGSDGSDSSQGRLMALVANPNDFNVAKNDDLHFHFNPALDLHIDDNVEFEIINHSFCNVTAKIGAVEISN